MAKLAESRGAKQTPEDTARANLTNVRRGLDAHDIHGALSSFEGGMSRRSGLDEHETGGLNSFE